jgi:uncharacterized UPF0146 family protein
MSCIEVELGIKRDDAYKLSDSTCACILIDLKEYDSKELVHRNVDIERTWMKICSHNKYLNVRTEKKNY